MSLRVGVLSVLLFAGSAFAHHHSIEGDYTGSGFWKMADGSKGKWEMTSTVKKTTDGAEMKDSLTIHMADGTEKKMEEEWALKHTGHGFFEVQKKGAKVGTGYCGFKQCHLQSEDGGNVEEETVTFHKKKIYRIGSHTSKEGTVVWQGSMQKVKPTSCDKCPKN